MSNNVFEVKKIGGKFANLISTVLGISETLIPLTEIESDLATIKNGNEIVFKDTCKIFLSFIGNLEKTGGAAADGVELWFEMSDDDGVTWNNVDFSGFLKEFNAFNEGSISYSTQLNIRYGEMLRIKALSYSGAIELHTHTTVGGAVQPGFILNVAKL